LTPRAGLGTLPRAGVKLLKKKEPSMKKSLIVIAFAAVLSQPVLAAPPAASQSPVSVTDWLYRVLGWSTAASEQPGHDVHRAPSVSTASEQPGPDLSTSASEQPDHD
jgi:hypothetical protein